MSEQSLSGEFVPNTLEKKQSILRNSALKIRKDVNDIISLKECLALYFFFFPFSLLPMA
jgi:hypothetical protein